MAQGFIQYHVVTRAEVPPLTALRDYLIAANGVFVHSQRPELAICLPVADLVGSPSVFGLAALHPYVQLNRPRIPQAIVATMLDLAQSARLADGRAAEILFYVRWRDESWHLIVPEQEQQIDAVRPVGAGIGAGEGVFLEAHSHHAWPGRFSPTDDADETGFARCYAVFGTIYTTPTIRARLQFYGHRWEIPASWLMEVPDGLVDLVLTPIWAAQEVS